MGVTIHFEGRVKGATACSLLIDEISEFAANHGWRVEEIPRASRSLKRVRDEQNWDYSGPTFGIVLSPHPGCDPLRFEFDKDFYIQEFVKTQFAGAETHIAIVELLRRIHPFFDALNVGDEGEFWDTSDDGVLQQHIERCNEVLRDLLAKNPNAKGPIRLPDGRIADFMS
ncbi:MAG TPA: hypothetical protein VIV62_05040 [Chthoniobacterales bacterium]|jgi:hypothetical protein